LAAFLKGRVRTPKNSRVETSCTGDLSAGNGSWPSCKNAGTLDSRNSSSSTAAAWEDRASPAWTTRKTLYFLASLATRQQHLRQSTEVMRETFPDPVLRSLTFTDWETVLTYLGERARTKRVLVILDEFPYLCEAAPELPSTIQRFIAPYLDEYIGHVFEEVARSYMPLYASEELRLLPVLRVGREWGDDFEIDIIAEHADGSWTFGECKWPRGPVGERVIYELQNKWNAYHGSPRS